MWFSATGGFHPLGVIGFSYNPVIMWNSQEHASLKLTKRYHRLTLNHFYMNFSWFWICIPLWCCRGNKHYLSIFLFAFGLHRGPGALRCGCAFGERLNRGGSNTEQVRNCETYSKTSYIRITPSRVQEYHWEWNCSYTQEQSERFKTWAAVAQRYQHIILYDHKHMWTILIWGLWGLIVLIYQKVALSSSVAWRETVQCFCCDFRGLIRSCVKTAKDVILRTSTAQCSVGRFNSLSLLKKIEAGRGDDVLTD